MIYNLSNKTASEKYSNAKFKEYLKHTKTKYTEKNKSNDILQIEIKTEEKSEIDRIDNAIGQLITCGQNRQVAYGY